MDKRLYEDTEECMGLNVWMQSVRMTREELAKSLGYSSNLLWRILGGSRAITDSFRWKFGAVFGFEVAIRVLGLNRPVPTNALIEKGMKEEAKE